MKELNLNDKIEYLTNQNKFYRTKLAQATSTVTGWITLLNTSWTQTRARQTRTITASPMRTRTSVPPTMDAQKKSRPKPGLFHIGY